MGRGKNESSMEWWIAVRAAERAAWERHHPVTLKSQPLYTGYKRNYRKAKYRPTDKGDKLWCERYESRPKCWKDQRGKGRNKRVHQYRPIEF